jgi:hypothetical protein
MTRKYIPLIILVILFLLNPLMALLLAIILHLAGVKII